MCQIHHYRIRPSDSRKSKFCKKQGGTSIWISHLHNFPNYKQLGLCSTVSSSTPYPAPAKKWNRRPGTPNIYNTPISLRSHRLRPQPTSASPFSSRPKEAEPMCHLYRHYTCSSTRSQGTKSPNCKSQWEEFLTRTSNCPCKRRRHEFLNSIFPNLKLCPACSKVVEKVSTPPVTITK